MPQWLTRHRWLWIVAAAMIVLLAFAACDDDEPTEEEATAQLCEDLDALEAADAAFDDLGADSTIDEVEAANDAYNEALDNAVSSAQDVVDVRTQPIEDAYDTLDQAINDIPGDATIAEGLASIVDELAAVDAAWAQAFGGVDCGDGAADETPVGETPTVEKVQPTIPLTIGHANSFTGDLSDFGAAHNDSAMLALAEINAAGGVGGQPIELVSGDTATDPSQGATETTRLIEIEGADFIVGALSSGVTLQIAESVTGPNNVLQISGASTSPGLTVANDNDFLFRTTISDAAQGVILAQLVSDMGLTSVCNMYINNAYGEGLSDSFKENFEAAGGTITAAVPHESEAATYAAELAECTAGSPEALAAIAYPESAGVFLREAVEAGSVGTFLFVDGTKSTDMLDDLGWANFDGTRGTAPSALALETGEAFEAAYAAAYVDVPPLPFMRETYDAIYLMALATEKALTDDIDIRDALREIANPPGDTVNPGTEGFTAALAAIAAGNDINYEGAAGPVDFDENGDVLIGAIETFTVDAANEDLVTDAVYKVDLTTGEVTKVE